MAGRKKVRRKAGKTIRKQALPAWMWFVAGLLVGLGLATFGLLKGYIPQPNRTSAEAEVPVPNSDIPDRDAIATTTEGPERREYDFFTRLPEAEVIVPQQEIRQEAQQATQPGSTQEAPATQGPYVIQIASFSSANDAERVKAELALQGIIAFVQVAEISGDTFHRVRVGPVTSAREVESIQQSITAAGHTSRVYRAN